MTTRRQTRSVLTLVATFIVMGLMCPLTVSAALITGVTIEDVSSELSSLCRFAVDSVNGTGLTAGAHDTNPANMWEAEGTFQGGTDTPPWHITFDMEANYALNSIHVWNFNEAGSLSTAGAKDVEIFVSPGDNNSAQLRPDLPAITGVRAGSPSAGGPIVPSESQKYVLRYFD